MKKYILTTALALAVATSVSAQVGAGDLGLFERFFYNLFTGGQTLEQSAAVSSTLNTKTLTPAIKSVNSVTVEVVTPSLEVVSVEPEIIISPSTILPGSSGTSTPPDRNPRPTGFCPPSQTPQGVGFDLIWCNPVTGKWETTFSLGKKFKYNGALGTVGIGADATSVHDLFVKQNSPKAAILGQGTNSSGGLGNGAVGVSGSSTGESPDVIGVLGTATSPGKPSDSRAVMANQIGHGYGFYQQGINARNYFQGKLGVGRDASQPSETLDVDGNIRIRGGTPVAGLVLTAMDNTGKATWQRPTGGSGGDSWWTTAPNGGIRNSNRGSVGIGTDNPQPMTKLHVVADADQSAITAKADLAAIVGTATAPGGAAIIGHSQAQEGTGVGVSGEAINGVGVGGFSPNGVGVFGDSQGTEEKSAGVSGRNDANIGVLGTGKVGVKAIGTGKDPVALEAVGQVRITDGTQRAGRVLTSDATGLASWQTPITGSGGFWEGDEDGDIKNSNTGIVSIGSRLGLGTKDPAARLHINASNAANIFMDGIGTQNYGALGFGSPLLPTNYSVSGNGANTYINRPLGGTIRFRENNVNQVSILSGGKVGIGTAAPAERLDLGGGNIKMGYVTKEETVTFPNVSGTGVLCPSGQPIGGGCVVKHGTSSLSPSLVTSSPMEGGGGSYPYVGWACAWDKSIADAEVVSYSARVICANIR